MKIEKKLPAELFVAGEKRYTSLIVQNLLENAQKYNRAEGLIRVTAFKQNGEVVLTIGNTGPPIRALRRNTFSSGFIIVLPVQIIPVTDSG